MSLRKAKSDLLVRGFASFAEWTAWLASQPASSQGIWLKLAKAKSGIPSITKQEAIDGALCCGWIDGQLDSFDANHWLIRFTPRRHNGKWSQKNRERALVLIELGQMQPDGLREIEEAKRDGRWEAAYPPQSEATVPSDLQSALDRNRTAKRLFAELDSRNRFAILYRIHGAKKPQTRAQRIEKFIAMLGRGETIHPRRALKKSSPRRPPRSPGR